MLNPTRLLLAFSLLTLLSNPARPQAETHTLSSDRDVAALFAPIFYQALGDKPRCDFITNFDFDGDWRGDNNWQHAEDTHFRLRAYIYYAVSETATHFFIHYAVFHPQDYKGGRGGAIFGEAIREGIKLGGKYDPTGLSMTAAMSHENDMEGCLVVVEKNIRDLRLSRVVYVETLAHNKFSKYVAGDSNASRFVRVKLEGQRPSLYVEPKGHGIEAYRPDDKQMSANRLLVYSFHDLADDPEAKSDAGTISYQLLPLSTTLWARAQKGKNETYGTAHDYGSLTLNVIQKNGTVKAQKFTLGTLGSAFRGTVRAPNVARPPWAWIDVRETRQALGGWFFDPAQTIKRHFVIGENFSTAYLSHPLLNATKQ